MKTDILVIGGGLSGLALSARLHAEGRDVQLVEARDRLGGRILSEGGFDLGPAWFWPGQPRIAALIKGLGLRRFDQFARGALSFEDEHGRVERGRGFASMEGSWRLDGGLGRLIDELARELPADRVYPGAPVRRLTATAQGIAAETATGLTIEARRAVLALPLRVARGITASPALPAAAAMEAVPTWMAGQAKAIAVYDHAFWREAGLSGDAMSRRGPMVEIHDASPVEGGPYALFGSIGVPPAARADADLLKEAVRAHLVRLFGPDAATPRALFVKDWAADGFTATPFDHAPLYAHPHYGLPRQLAGLWDGRLIFSGTENAPGFGGYLEGALEAAEIALDTLSEPAGVDAR